MRPLRIGIVGAGNISAIYLATLNLSQTGRHIKLTTRPPRPEMQIDKDFPADRELLA